MLARAGKILLVAAGALALAGPAAAGELDEWFAQSYPLPAGGTLSLTNVNGSVLVQGWDEERVEIRALMTARGSTEDLERVRIEVQAGGAALRVVTRYPEDRSSGVLVSYHLRVPRRLRLVSVLTVNGNIQVRDVTGTGTLRTVNGDIEVLEGAGSFSARTMNGDVRIELGEVYGAAAAAIETVNGSVVLVLASDADADLHVDSRNGDFRSELPLRLLSAADAAMIHGRLGRGGTSLRLRTVNGGIRVVTARPLV